MTERVALQILAKPHKNASAFLGASQANQEICTHMGEGLPILAKPQKNASAFLGASQANHEICTHMGEALRILAKPQKNASAFLGASQTNHEICTHMGEALLSIPRKTGTNKKASLLGLVTRLLTQVAKIHFCPLGRFCSLNSCEFSTTG